MDKSSSESEREEKTKPRKKPRLTSQPSSSRLCAHRMSLRSAATQDSTSSSSSSTSEPDTSREPAKNTTKQEDAGNQDDNTQDSQQPKEKLVTTHHGLTKRPKRVRKFRCKICNGIFNSTREWNKHYEENHPILSCQDCGKMFRNPTSLYRHCYIHTKMDKIFPCPKCDHTFPFVGQLKSASQD